ncbi:hypothetical protein AA0119_g13596 [Alternaria tenuissima]|uniref:Uncharacterized protein n=2 Tax=Alternaria alternata complex TaxID=187734 RepID=A0A4V1WN32_ALTAL|nr:hypothetical protein AA0115_g12585 [Alternaria tenuissima]RYN28580.1 hypothetical protein AA0114_g12440 [Alternaria tenuissima]RYN51411.1 hypothetical protein AA0117_g13393 [Alternaria alternata]RYN75076.1 hypothetical protein AA0119_g13596 [Alternaria tenuissima]RYN94701.1 hypothetical protein AA0121_g13592 [Alternaria tenuissima]
MDYQEYHDPLFDHDFPHSGANGQVGFSPGITGNHDPASQPPSHVPMNDPLYTDMDHFSSEMIALAKQGIQGSLTCHDKTHRGNEKTHSELSELKRGQEELLRRLGEFEERSERRAEQFKRAQDDLKEELLKRVGEWIEESRRRHEEESKKQHEEFKRQYEQLRKLIIELFNSGRRKPPAPSYLTRPPRPDYPYRTYEPAVPDQSRPAMLRREDIEQIIHQVFESTTI